MQNVVSGTSRSSLYNDYWMRKLKTLDEQSDTDMIFAKMPTEKEI